MDTPTLLERIKQRKTVHWAVAYVGGAWLFLEILGRAIELFGWPGGIEYYAFVLAAFGFCGVLFLPLLLPISSGVQGTPVEAKPSPGSKAQKGSDAGSVGLSHEPDRVPIAVLPFDDFSPNSDDSYFADGIHEEITSRLATISALAVKGRTSVGRYRVDPPPIPTIGQELGVSFLLEGSARIAGDRVRLTAQLIDAALDEHIWTETYDRRFSVENLFEVQGDIAQQVALAIGTEISPEDKVRIASRPTADLQAYVSYMKGMESWKQFNDEGTQQAIDYFNHAIALDPSFAAAYAGLGTTYAQLGLGFGKGDEAPHEVMPLAREAAQRAIQLDPESPDGYENLGFISLTYDFDYPEAERLLTRAVELDPDRGISYGMLAHVYSVTGRHDRAVELSRQGLELDPYEPVNTTVVGFVLLNARRIEDALAAAEQARALHPNFPEMVVQLALVYSFQGQYAEAVEAVQRISGSDGQSPKIRSMLAYNLARMGNEGAAREILEELLALADERYVSAKWIGYVYMGLGEDAQALEWFERAVDDRADWIVWINLLPGIDGYASNPRFQEILRRMNLSAELPEGGALPG